MSESEPKQPHSQEEFAAAYIALCLEMGWTHAAQPKLKPMSDLGGFLIAVEFVLVPYQEPKP